MKLIVDMFRKLADLFVGRCCCCCGCWNAAKCEGNCK